MREIDFKYSRFVNKLRMTAIKFLDKAKEIVKCKKSCEGTHCYWDRHLITGDNVIRCPTRYVPSEYKRVHVTRGGSSYVIKEKITKKDRKRKTVPSDIITVQKEYYETEGVFCSLRCCVAYVQSNAHNPIYDESIQLLMKMYNIVQLPQAVLIGKLSSSTEDGYRLTSTENN